MSGTPPQGSTTHLDPLPSFDVRREDGDGAVTLRLFGELDIASCEGFARILSQAEQAPVTRITVDLAGLSFIDSSGLRVLARAGGQNDGRLRLLRGSQSVQRLFELTGFDTELPFDD